MALLVAQPRADAQAAEPAIPLNKAKELYDAGLADFKAQKYDTAVSLLSQSFALDPQAQTLFAWAQSERLRFHCDEAARLFDQFIAMNPPARQVAAAELAKRRCTPAPAVVSTPTVAVPPPPAVIVRAPLWYRDAWGGALCGLGAATTAAGLALVVNAHALAGQAEGAETLGQSQSDRRVAEQRWAWGIGMTLVGAALFAGGVARYVWVSKADDRMTVSTGGNF
ncbi:MAG: hypothetical protein SF187_03225 [Deltaproteobacteria bacterium]|nr:hypothetical protein [Deltaproteobacteria bacterium]